MKIGIVGTGPAALMAGSQFLLNGHEITFFEHKKAAGRKFLVAGHGGFNLSHSESEEQFLSRYSHDEIKRFVAKFDNEKLVKWLKLIGIETYVGSTGKIFPAKGIKPIEVLEAWLTWLKNEGAIFLFQHKMIDFSDKSLLIQNNSEKKWHDFDKIVFALGGISWSKTGSDGAWLSIFDAKQIAVEPLLASNAGININFKTSPEKMQGEIIKNCKLSHNHTVKLGEVTLTTYGLEGAAVYFLNPSFRQNPELPILIDFKPQFTLHQVQKVFLQSKNSSEGLKKLKLSKGAIWLLKNELLKDEFTDSALLSEKIKTFPIPFQSLRPIEEAISTSGGVSWGALNEDLSLKKFPNIHLCGEMLDWDAPTGGYLLQACFATGFAVGNSLKRM